MAGLNPQTFHTHLMNQGLSRDFLFRVMGISLPGVMPADVSDQLIFARTASYPGRIIEDMVVESYGQEYHLGGRAVYENAANYPIEFYVPGDFKLRDLFEKASRTAHEDGVGVNDVGVLAVAADGWITLKGLPGAVAGAGGSKEIKLQGVQIRDIGEINYLIADGIGEVVSFTVTFAYQKYTGPGSDSGSLNY